MPASHLARLAPRLRAVALSVLAVLWIVVLAALANGRRVPFEAASRIDPDLSARPGLNLRAEDLTPERLAPLLDRLSAQGIRFVRLTLSWDEIEPQRGQFAWQRWDDVFATFAAHPDLIPVVVLDRSPAWARTVADAGIPLAPPHERRDFGAFARAVAERYGEQVTYYQVWEEPNIAPHWGARGADPMDYLGLLREGAVNLRAADADAKVIAAALAPTVETGGANLSDITYLDQLYALGGRQWFDYPAVQPYGFESAADASANEGQLNFARATLLRDVMLRHGDAGTSLWATSFGWNAEGDGPWGVVSAGEQAGYTRMAFARADRAWPWLGPLLWTGRFAALPDTMQALNDAAAPPAVLSPGRHPPNHPALRYSGWRVTDDAADPSGDGDTLEFAFEGAGVALEVEGGAYWAYLTATVSGGPANRLPRDESGASYLVLHDPNARTRLIPLAEYLAPGPHTVRLTAHGGWGQWPLRGVIVSTDPSIRPAALGLPLLALTVIGIAGYALLAARPKGQGEWGQRNQVSTRQHRHEVTRWRRNLVSLALSFGFAAILAVAYHVSGSGLVNFVILGLFGMLFLVRPELAPPLIAASLPLWQRTQPVLRWQFGLFEALAWLALLALGGRWMLRMALPHLRIVAETSGWWPRTPSRRAAWLDRGIVALTGAGLLASFFAAEQGVAWREFRIVFLFGLVFYWLIVERGPHGRGPLVAGLLAGAAIASVAGLWQLVSGQGRVEVEGVSRIAAFYGSPNNLALLLDRAAPLAAALALFAGSRSSGGRWLRATVGAVALLTIAAAVATFSKGAVLLGLPAGLAVVLIGGAWRNRQRWPLALLLVAAAIGAVGVLFLFRTERFSDLFNFEAGTSFFRLKLWQGSLNMALDHPLLGVGPDNFLYAYRTRYVLPSAWQELNLSHPHNLPLDLWTRLGLVGVVAGVLALGAAFAAARRAVVSNALAPEDPAAGWASWPLALGLLGALAATVAHGMIDNSLFLPDLMGWFVATVALLRLNEQAEVDGAAEEGGV